MKIERFEDCPIWQKARELVKGIYVTTSETQSFKQDFGLKDQIRRAAVSVMSNIAEGYARRSDKAFSNFLHIAHGSASEVQSQLYIALDLNYLTKEKFDRLYVLCDEINRQTHGLIKYLNKSTPIP